MVENQHRRIDGYRDLTETEIALMNRIKAHERATAALHAEIQAATAGSHQSARDCAIARTHFEDAHIRLVRAIARPLTPWVS